MVMSLHAIPRRPVVVQSSLALALALSCSLAASCGGEGALVQVELVLPSAPDPFSGVVRVRLSASGTGMPPLSREAARGAGGLELPPLAYGPDRVITLEGIDAAGVVISSGTSVPFELTEERPERVKVYFARLERFSSATARLSLGRYDHSATTLADGRVVIAGGRDGAGAATASVEIYDPLAGAFSAATPLKRARAAHHAVLAGDRIVFIGGSAAAGPLGSVEIYSVGQGTERELTLETPRTGSVAAPLPSGAVLVAGGADSAGKVIDSTEIIDPAAGLITAGPKNASVGTDALAAALADGKVLVAGGYQDPPGKLQTAAALYDAAAAGGGKWLPTGKLPEGRRGALGLSLSDGRVLIVGGEGPAGPTRAAFTFGGGAFSALASQTAATHRAFAASPLAGGDALVAGGTDSRQAERFDGTAFRAVGELIRQREHFTLSTLPDGKALDVGGREKGAALADVERFNPR